MGTFRVGCKVVNVADPKKSVMVRKMLIDTGSDHTWLPAKMLEKIGVERVKKINVELRNGEEVRRDIGFAILRTEGFVTVDEVVFAESNDVALLGARTLSGFNARPDFEREKLVPGEPLWAATAKRVIDEVTLMSETALAKDWLRPEEEAWRHLADLPDLGRNRKRLSRV